MRSSHLLHAAAGNLPSRVPVRRFTAPSPASLEARRRPALLFVLAPQPSPRFVFPPVTPQRRHAHTSTATCTATPIPRAAMTTPRLLLLSLPGACQAHLLRAAGRAPGTVATTAAAPATPGAAARSRKRYVDSTANSPRLPSRRSFVRLCPSRTSVSLSWYTCRRDPVPPSCAGHHTGIGAAHSGHYFPQPALFLQTVIRRFTTHRQGRYGLEQ